MLASPSTISPGKVHSIERRDSAIPTELSLNVIQVRGITFRRVVASMFAQHGLRCKFQLSLGGKLLGPVGMTETNAGNKNPMIWEHQTGQTSLHLNLTSSLISLGVEILCGSMLVASTTINLHAHKLTSSKDWYNLFPDGEIELEMSMSKRGNVEALNQDSDDIEIDESSMNDDNEIASDGEPSPEKHPPSKESTRLFELSPNNDDCTKNKTLGDLDTSHDPNGKIGDEVWKLYKYGISSGDVAEKLNDDKSSISTDTASTFSRATEMLNYTQRLLDLEQSESLRGRMFEWTQRIATLEKVTPPKIVLYDENNVIRERRRSLPLQKASPERREVIKPQYQSIQEIQNASSTRMESLRRTRSASVHRFRDIIDYNSTCSREKRRPAKQSQRLELGRQIIIAEVPGIVRYIGATQFESGIWIGVELLKPLGKNNGSVHGVEYFSCAPQYGIFIRANRLDVSFN